MTSARKKWSHLLIGAALLGALAVAALVWSARRPAPPEPPAVDLTHADPEVAEAVQEALTRVREAPRSGKAWGRLGMVLAIHELAPEAVAALAEAERLEPSEPRWPYLQGTTLEKLGHQERAVAKLRRAAELTDEPAVRLTLAEVLPTQGQLEEATSLFDADRSRNGRAELGLARIAHARGDLRGSLEHLHRAAAQGDRRDIEALLVNVCSELGDWAGARRARARLAARPSDPPWPDPYRDEARALAVGERARSQRARALWQAGRRAEALDLLARSVRLYPNSGYLWRSYASILVEVHQDRRAEHAFRQALRCEPRRFETEMHLGFARYRQRQQRPEALAEAIEVFRQALRHTPSDGRAHFGLGTCLQERGPGAWGEAIVAYRAALEYMPDSAEAHRNLAYLLLQCGDEAAVAVTLQRLVGCPLAVDVTLALRLPARAHLRHARQLAPRDRLTQSLVERLGAESP